MESAARTMCPLIGCTAPRHLVETFRRDLDLVPPTMIASRKKAAVEGCCQAILFLYVYLQYFSATYSTTEAVEAHRFLSFYKPRVIRSIHCSDMCPRSSSSTAGSCSVVGLAETMPAHNLPFSCSLSHLIGPCR